MSTSVAVIGGGPAGLYLARLVKLHDPSCQVVVHERMRGSDDTFGFGVGLTGSTMRHLTDADPVTAKAVRAVSFAGHELRLSTRGGSATLHGARNLAIGRAALLEQLAKAAAAAGVEIRSGSTADAGCVDADVIVAADGVGSKTRQALADRVGSHVRMGRTRFVWCGADFAVDSAYFAAVERGRSQFVAHAYPYAADRSTILVEVDKQTWEDSGLGDFDRQTPPGQTDHASVRLLEDVLAEQLHGLHLLTNRTRWSRFAEVGADRWSAGNVVLLGDAAHTAHYTLGSGTKLALEDAIALADSLKESASVGEAFEAYERLRRPPVERFKALASRSQAWWDSYRLRSTWPAEQLAISFMTRAGNLSLADYAKNYPDTVRRGLRWLADDAPAAPVQLEEWVLAQPVGRGDWHLDAAAVRADDLPDPSHVRRIEWNDPDVWGPEADVVVDGLSGHGGDPVLVSGPTDMIGMNARVDFAERLRLNTGRIVGVELPHRERTLAASTVAARRADYVAWQ